MVGIRAYRYSRKDLSGQNRDVRLTRPGGAHTAAGGLLAGSTGSGLYVSCRLEVVQKGFRTNSSLCSSSAPRRIPRNSSSAVGPGITATSARVAHFQALFSFLTWQLGASFLVWLPASPHCRPPPHTINHVSGGVFTHLTESCCTVVTFPICSVQCYSWSSEPFRF